MCWQNILELQRDWEHINNIRKLNNKTLGPSPPRGRGGDSLVKSARDGRCLILGCKFPILVFLRVFRAEC